MLGRKEGPSPVAGQLCGAVPSTGTSSWSSFMTASQGQQTVLGIHRQLTMQCPLHPHLPCPRCHLSWPCGSLATPYMAA